MRLRTIWLAAALAGVAVVAACTLNPQPLPPEASGGSFEDAGFASPAPDSGPVSRADSPAADAATQIDAALPQAAPEPDAGDAGDAGADADAH
jgi:hypothetical protein